VQLLFDLDMRLDTVAFNGRPVWHCDGRFFATGGFSLCTRSYLKIVLNDGFGWFAEGFDAVARDCVG
jgi:hypothetical protein